MIPVEIDPYIIKLFPSKKSGAVETGLWRIPIFFDRSFGRNRGSIKLRRYLVHMAEVGEPDEALIGKMMEKYQYFSNMINNYPGDTETRNKRMEQLNKYFLEFADEVSEHVHNPNIKQIF